MLKPVFSSKGNDGLNEKKDGHTSVKVNCQIGAIILLLSGKCSRDCIFTKATENDRNTVFTLAQAQKSFVNTKAQHI